MTMTVQQYVSNTREMMDAASSARWTDAFITQVLGYIHSQEWSSLLNANPYTRFSQLTPTTDSAGCFTLDSLNSGSGDTKKYWYRLLALTDGTAVYRETQFITVPLATTANYGQPYQRMYYLAGDNYQVLPVTANLSLTATVNWTPPRIDQLASQLSVVDFPDGHESIVWNLAGADLLTKGGAEVQAADALRQIAAAQRDQMYQDLSRRSARPLFMGYGDTGADWGGSY